VQRDGRREARVGDPDRAGARARITATSPTERRPAVYLAGPDVFFDRPRECGQRLKDLAANFGFVGLYPLDAVVELTHVQPNASISPAERVVIKRENAARIREANMAMIRDADAVCANVLPFRGPSADVGTAWKMGYAAGLGKIVASYSHNAQSYATRVLPDNFAVEDFALHDNFMLAGAQHFRTPETALQYILDVFRMRRETGRSP
jgi:nucleoside 2-deoxyribosyltransferase